MSAVIIWSAAAVTFLAALIFGAVSENRAKKDGAKLKPAVISDK